LAKIAEASGADQIKSCRVFTIPRSPGDGHDGTRFRDELSLSIANKLSGPLQAEGLEVTVASPASHGAVFYIKFDRFKVAVVLSGVMRVGVSLSAASLRGASAAMASSFPGGGRQGMDSGLRSN
jgi:hypothetical protein